MAQATEKLLAIIDRFDKAAESLRYPKLYIADPDSGQRFRLHQAGPASNAPGAVTITSANGQRYHGRIMRDGALRLARDTDEQTVTALCRTLHEFVQNPAQAARIYGHQFNHCCFCGRELVETSSVTLGYGPVCAERWGLPHGQLGTWEPEPVSLRDDDIAALFKA